MKIKQLKEKTAQGLKDFLPKIGVSDIEGLIDALNDKLSKSQGGEINKPIVITNTNSEYSFTINPDSSVYIWSKKSQRNIFSIIPFVSSTIISGNNISISSIESLSSIYQSNQNIYNAYSDSFTASKFKLRTGTNNQVLLGDGSTTSKLVSYISPNTQSDAYIVNILNIDGAHDSFTISGATKELAGLMTAVDKAKLDNIPNIYAEKDEALKNIEISQATEDDFDEGVTLLMHYAKPSVASRMAVIDNATTTKDGCMSHEDKKVLDNIPNTYLPLSGGTLTGALYVTNLSSASKSGFSITNVTGIQHSEQDKTITPEVWTTDGNSIPIDKAGGVPTLNQEGVLDGYVSTVNGQINTGYYQNQHLCYLNISGNFDIEGSAGIISIERIERVDEYLSSNTIISLDGKDGSIEAVSATFTDKVKANGFVANNNGNSNTAWTTNGETIDLINLLSNAAIYVAGKFEIAESGIDNTTVVDNPDSIIYDSSILGGRFLARKYMICYTHWKADISKNIAPPSRYGIETDNGVFPFNNQMYKFSGRDDIYIATCSNGTCSMKKLTLK